MRTWPLALPVAVLLASLAGAPPARAGSLARLDAAVHRVLDDDAGWRLHREPDGDGITIFEKRVPGSGLTAFKGVKVLDPAVDPQSMFTVIEDIEGQARFAPMLLESTVVAQAADSLAYYQVMRPPRLVPGSERFWVCTSQIERDLGGEPGHQKRSWSAAPAGEMDRAHADLRARYAKAIEVEYTHGSWELDPQPDGTVLYIYRTVTHPGGSVPDGLARMLSSRTLPDNMLSFERAAKGR
jgi:hypothetical protein